MMRGVLLTAYDALSERMAYALMRSIRLWNVQYPIIVLGMDYICGLDWARFAEVRSVRATGANHTEERWFNKLGALLASPFDETLYLDSDMVVLADVEAWIKHLGTDDFTFFNVFLRPEDVPDTTIMNVVNPYRVREHYGVDGIRIIESGGHFFFRNTARGQRLVERIAEVMQDALEHGPLSLYGRMAGRGNIAASDEIAAALVAIEEQIALPPPIIGTHRHIGIYMPPYQEQGKFDFDTGRAEYYDSWRGNTVTSGAVHFCSHGKWNPTYREWVDKQVEQGQRERLSG